MHVIVFQIVAITVLVVLMVTTLVAVFRNILPRRFGLVWVFVWIAGAIAVAWPSGTNLAARPLGIQRGADFVFYCAVVFMLIGFFMVYVRMRRLDACITQLVRHMALKEMEEARRDERQ